MAPQTKRRRTGTNAGVAAASTPNTRSSAAAKAGVSGTTQSTLSFRASKAVSSPALDVKEKQNKASPSHSIKEPEPELVQQKPDTHDISVTDDEHSLQRDAQVEAPIQEEEDDDEADAEEIALREKALKLSDSKMKAYWNLKQKERKAPRVHQKDISLREKILREWDMSSRYGPSTGISRSDRWWRAHGLGMQPPIEVLGVLLQGGQKEGSVVDDLVASTRTSDGAD